MLKFCFSSSVNSSMRAVAIGSNAEHGSSMRITSGLTAMARAMHSRCCWPPERLVPGAASIGNILIDRFRKGIGFLKNHAGKR
jgi:hypothetical protein